MLKSDRIRNIEREGGNDVRGAKQWAYRTWQKNAVEYRTEKRSSACACFAAAVRVNPLQIPVVRRGGDDSRQLSDPAPRDDRDRHGLPSHSIPYF